MVSLSITPTSPFSPLQSHHTQCIGAVMLAIGLYSILSLQQYGFFTQNMYTPPAAIFVAVGAVKIVFGVIGLVAMCLKKSPIFAIVS